MNHYQGLATECRPKQFSEVLGQDPVVKTIKNALLLGRVGQAYLLCGMSGTGKTTLARLFARAVNCDQLSKDLEPCHRCKSCQDSQTLNIIEIDGASNRGVDDIRTLNETVIYGALSGKRKVYIIDEVHMLTKEAFNALLKTLEEPPKHVIFFFATTEPDRIPQTVIGRCQRFDLLPISIENVSKKLNQILQKLDSEAEAEAIELIAHHAEGSLREAESLLDSLLCFHDDKKITLEGVEKTLRTAFSELFFKLDKAAKENDLLFAFELSDQISKQGIHLNYFLEGLAKHYRTLLVAKLGKEADLSLLASNSKKKRYIESKDFYLAEQILTILDILNAQFEKIASSPFKRINLEILLLQIIRSTKRLSLDTLVNQLVELKKTVKPSEEFPTSEKGEKKNSLTQEQPVIQKKIKHEKIMQFTSVELSGSIRK